MRKTLLAALCGVLLPALAWAQAIYITTFQGTMSLSAATSTAMTQANVTMAPGTYYPTTFNRLVVINTGSNSVYVCWAGGTASASSGCELLIAGASDTVTLSSNTAPTFYSASGTTIAFRN